MAFHEFFPRGAHPGTAVHQASRYRPWYYSSVVPEALIWAANLPLLAVPGWTDHRRRHPAPAVRRMETAMVGRVSVLVHPKFRGRGAWRRRSSPRLSILARHQGLEKIEGGIHRRTNRRHENFFGMLGFLPLCRLSDYVKDHGGRYARLFPARAGFENGRGIRRDGLTRGEGEIVVPKPLARSLSSMRRARTVPGPRVSRMRL